jgi:hypothetical protein
VAFFACAIRSFVGVTASALGAPTARVAAASATTAARWVTVRLRVMAPPVSALESNAVDVKDIRGRAKRSTGCGNYVGTKEGVLAFRL